MEILRKSIEIGGRTLTLETGRMARQAGGAIFATYGDTMILATATASSKPREGISFFPLTVEFEEKMYAVGKIPGGFIKREGRPSEKAILSARLLDRPIRPLFPDGYRNDVQVVNTVLSVDQDSPIDVTAMIASSTALTISDIPFKGPIAGVTVGQIDNNFIINPTVEEKEKTEMHVTVAGTKDAIMMVEAEASEVPEETMLEAIMFAFEEIKKIADFCASFREEALALNLAKEKQKFESPIIQKSLEDIVNEVAYESLKTIIHNCAKEKLSKQARESLVEENKEASIEEITNKIKTMPEYKTEDAEEIEKINQDIAKLIKDIEKDIFRKMIAKDKIRIDGRETTEVRPLDCGIGVLSRTHGSGLFTRGQTQVLSTCTLAPVSEEQILDGLGLEKSKRYMHQYNFPPYSVGETRPMRGPGRREIGHGALAERALLPIIPAEEDFPYALRVVSEVIESNGSSSMASVCGSTLALMDAGVPIKNAVSGIAMGLIKHEDDLTILTDIQGMEDFLGDMDFKVAGTKNGITAIQMDIKIDGIDKEVLAQALAQAKEGRFFILNKMLETIDKPRAELSEYAPRILQISIDPDKIRDVIGSGGKVIKKIIEETDAQIDIEDDGSVFIASVDAEKGEQALKIIENIVQEPVIGKIYNGKVVKIMDFGAFVEIIPGVLGSSGKDGMVHISQLDNRHVKKVEDVCKEGEIMPVKVIDIDKQGRVKLSRKEALAELRAKENEKNKE